MGYTELGRKRPIVVTGDHFDKILIYQWKGEVWGVCYNGDVFEGIYNYTYSDFIWSEALEMTLKEMVKKIIHPLKRSAPGAYTMIDYRAVREELNK